MPDKITLNRFPLFGLFVYRAARKMGYSEEEAHLLGYSTALLYAIFKAKATAKKKTEPKERKVPEEVRKAKTETLTFGGQEYEVVYGKDKRLKQTVVGHELHEPVDYDAEVEAKFPKGWHDRLAKAFDGYLDACDPDELNKGNTLFDLYKAWRDQCKAGFNRVDLGKLAAWLKEHEGEA